MAAGWKRHLVGEFSWRRLVASGLGVYAIAGAFLYLRADRLIFLPPEASYPAASVRDLPPSSLASLAQLEPWASTRISRATPAFLQPGPEGLGEPLASGPAAPPLQAPPEGRYRLPWRSGGPATVVHWLPHPQARFTVLYSHGNAEDLGQVLPILKALQGQGLSVLAHDYPGYGHSAGEPNRWNASAAVGRAYALLRAWGTDPQALVLFGRSVGGGPTLELAQALPARALILESTFTSVQRVRFPVRLFPFDAFDSLGGLAQLRLPTLVIHGTQDELIPFAHGQALHEAAQGPKRHLWVEGAGHDDLLDFAGPRWGVAIAQFLADLDRGFGQAP